MNSENAIRKNSKPFRLTLKEADEIEYDCDGYSRVVREGAELVIAPTMNKDYGYIVMYKNMAFMVKSRAISFEKVYAHTETCGDYYLFVEIDIEGFIMSLRLDAPTLITN